MTPDEKHEQYMKIYKEVAKHAKPSEDTLKFMKKMEKEIGEVPLILEKIKNINDHFGKDGIVSDIKNHVQRTNGRVLKLETWRAYLLGGWAALTGVIVVLFPIMFFYFIDNFRYEMRDMIRGEISTAIEHNNNEYFEE